MRKNGVCRAAAFFAAAIFCITSFVIPAAADGASEIAGLKDYEADYAAINTNLIPDASEQRGFKYLCVNNQYEVTYDTPYSDQALTGMCRWYLRAGTGMLSMEDKKYKGFAGFTLNQRAAARVTAPSDLLPKTGKHMLYTQN